MMATHMIVLWMVDQQNTDYNWQTSGPSFPWRQLILGGLVPITVFYTLHRLGQPLIGALLAIGWSIGLLVFKYWHSRSIELFPALAIPIVLIELIVTLITRNPHFYLASAAIDNVLWGLLFLGSLLLIRPLIQIFAELLNPGLGSQEFFSHFEMPLQLYRSAWKILTIIWAVVSLIKAIILVLSQLKLPLEVFLIVRTASGFPVLVLMLIFTYRFPRWYWARARVNSQ
jgi:intracellular septation protein A